ncbi:MAG TPA: acylneuraminate cytidylyltransferase [Anaerolineaceae bacterium]|jgi:N-acylneuraminate cytidylyltransferase|nr:acylneuraminate cytidylyltransferase [Anaerolineaceae bacterium]HQK42502.1 acylneuraminate cytidylyltransferase [Anaerolineaceae bacterium]
MVKQPEVLALIPARGGSKGIPRKNIREFAGAPLIAWSIAAALRAETVTRVIVSTDDEEIAAVAREWGAETPFLRPAELAQDDTADYPVFRQALDWLAAHEDYRPEVVVQLRPTSPVRPLHLVDDAVRLLLAHPDADCVRGVVPSGQNPYKMWKIDAESGRMLPLLQVEGLAEPYNAPRQSLPKTYWQTGHIDAIQVSTILEKGSLTGDEIWPLMIDPRYTVDIDTPADWERYERLLQDPHIQAVDPLVSRRAFPARVRLLLMDFDGVLSDDLVLTDQDGRESLRCSRSDGFGLSLLREKTDIQAAVLSREENPVVSARCRKLKLEVFQGVRQKDQALKALIQARGWNPAEILYLGNDLPDLPVLPQVGYFAAPADAHPDVLRRADLILKHRGGRGAVREICERLLLETHKTNLETL